MVSTGMLPSRFCVSGWAGPVIKPNSLIAKNNVIAFVSRKAQAVREAVSDFMGGEGNLSMAA